MEHSSIFCGQFRESQSMALDKLYEQHCTTLDRNRLGLRFTYNIHSLERPGGRVTNYFVNGLQCALLKHMRNFLDFVGRVPIAPKSLGPVSHGANLKL